MNENNHYDAYLIMILSHKFNHTNSINATPLFFPTDARLHFRLRIIHSACQTNTVSNVETIENTCKTGPVPNGGGRMSVSPNPTAAGRIVTVKTNYDGLSKVDLKTIEGNRLNVTVLSITKGVVTVKLPENIASGTYLLTINNQNGQWVEKIVVNN